MTVLYRPGEAGRMIGIKPSTLRVYVQRFSDLLSDDATAADRPGYRLFTDQDVSLLKQARELLDRGFTYERAAAQLRGSRPVKREPPARRAATSDVAALESAVEAWKSLADARAAEVTELRAEVRALREMLHSHRRRRLAPRN